MTEMTDYVIPDGSVVQIYTEVARNAPSVSYQLKGGSIVAAIRADLWESETPRRVNRDEQVSRYVSSGWRLDD